MPLHPQQRINRFEKNFSAYRLIIVVIISCVLMYQDYQKNYLSVLRVYLSASFYPAQYLINLPNNFIQKLNINFSEREKLLQENKSLKKDKPCVLNIIYSNHLKIKDSMIFWVHSRTEITA